MQLYCPEGHEVKVRFQPTAGERFCPEHGCPLRSPQRQRSGGKSESGAERRARMAFNRAVCEWPCFFQRHREGHHCSFPLDAHHLVPKEWIKRELDLPEDELIAVMYNPLIGAPLCRGAHQSVEARTQFIYFNELSPECIEFCERHGMLGRLEIESPQRKTAKGGTR
jgi:hypothetical protein